MVFAHGRVRVGPEPSFFEDYAALNGAEATPENTASMYFSSLYVTGTDGSLKVATLEPGDHNHPGAVFTGGARPTFHVEKPFVKEDETSIWNTQTIVVRCFKPASLIEGNIEVVGTGEDRLLHRRPRYRPQSRSGRGRPTGRMWCPRARQALASSPQSRCTSGSMDDSSSTLTVTVVPGSLIFNR